MKTLSSTDLRKNLSKVMDQVNDDHEPIIVTRANGKPAVLLSLEDYDSLDATTYLLSSKANRKALHQAILEGKAGHHVSKTMAELEALE
ncbi:MAG: type II toxin-antitoxin system Phd/YefM family antitoxin [Robiginitomaculum sp.]|nr:type II toxin-antitoxin system Phd/YefM family antitoxin [Robiginitomaculum sp.]